MTASIVVTKKRAVVAARVGSNQSIFCGSSHGQVGEELGAEDFAHILIHYAGEIDSTLQ